MVRNDSSRLEMIEVFTVRVRKKDCFIFESGHAKTRMVRHNKDIYYKSACGGLLLIMSSTPPNSRPAKFFIVTEFFSCLLRQITNGRRDTMQNVTLVTYLNMQKSKNLICHDVLLNKSNLSKMASTKTNKIKKQTPLLKTIFS